MDPDFNLDDYTQEDLDSALQDAMNMVFGPDGGEPPEPPPVDSGVSPEQPPVSAMTPGPVSSPDPVTQDDGSQAQNLPATITGALAPLLTQPAEANPYLSALSGDPFGYGQSVENFGAGKPENQRFGDAERNWRTGPDIEPYLAMVTGNREGLTEAQQRTYDQVSDNRLASRGGPTYGGLLGGLRGAIEGAVDRGDVQESFQRSGNERLLQPGSRGADVNWNQWAKEAAEGQPRIYPQMTPEGLMRVRQEGANFESQAVSGGAMGWTPIRFNNGMEGWLDKSTNRFYNRSGDRIGTEVSAADAMRRPAPAVQAGGPAGPEGPGGPEGPANPVTYNVERTREGTYDAGQSVKLPGGQIVTFSEPGQFEQFNGGAYYRFIAADGRTRVYDKQGNVIGEGRIPPATNPFAPKPNQPVTRPSQVTLPRNLTGVNG